MKDFEDFIFSKRARWIGGIVLAIILALLIFHAGVAFGRHHGPFGRRDEHGFRHPFFPGGFSLPHGFIPNSHGAVGVVTSVSLPTVAMQTRDGMSQTIFISTSTIIKNAGGTSAAALKVGSQIIVLGEPDGQGRVDAKLIRVISTATSTP